MPRTADGSVDPAAPTSTAAPFTNGLALTERFTRVDYGSLEIDVTIGDPKAYSRPFTVRVNWRLLPGDGLIEVICNENQRFSAGN